MTSKKATQILHGLIDAIQEDDADMADKAIYDYVNFVDGLEKDRIELNKIREYFKELKRLFQISENKGE